MLVALVTNMYIALSMVNGTWLIEYGIITWPDSTLSNKILLILVDK